MHLEGIGDIKGFLSRETALCDRGGKPRSTQNHIQKGPQKRGLMEVKGVSPNSLVNLCADLTRCLCVRLHRLEIGRRYNISSRKQDGENVDLTYLASET
jgi:hypothetical protein